MTRNLLLKALAIVAFCILTPIIAMAQADDARVDTTRARLATHGDDYAYTDDEKFLSDTLLTDTIPLKNPKKAGWLSFAIPGAGQVYNGQYWKVPIIYGGLGTLLYVSRFYGIRYKQLKQDERVFLKLDDGEPIFGLTNESDIVKYMVKYRRYRDLCYVGIALVYLMNVFDAVVDAHLYDYDISDDLSLRVEPFSQGPSFACHNGTFGARLVITF